MGLDRALGWGGIPNISNGGEQGMRDGKNTI